MSWCVNKQLRPYLYFYIYVLTCWSEGMEERKCVMREREKAGALERLKWKYSACCHANSTAIWERCACSNVPLSANNFSFHVKANTLCTYIHGEHFGVNCFEVHPSAVTAQDWQYNTKITFFWDKTQRTAAERLSVIIFRGYTCR